MARKDKAKPRPRNKVRRGPPRNPTGTRWPTAQHGPWESPRQGYAPGRRGTNTGALSGGGRPAHTSPARLGEAVGAGSLRRGATPRVRRDQELRGRGERTSVGQQAIRAWSAPTLPFRPAYLLLPDKYRGPLDSHRVPGTPGGPPRPHDPPGPKRPPAQNGPWESLQATRGDPSTADRDAPGPAPSGLTTRWTRSRAQPDRPPTPLPPDEPQAPPRGRHAPRKDPRHANPRRRGDPQPHNQTRRQPQTTKDTIRAARARSAPSHPYRPACLPPPERTQRPPHTPRTRGAWGRPLGWATPPTRPDQAVVTHDPARAVGVAERRRRVTRSRSDDGPTDPHPRPHPPTSHQQSTHAPGPPRPCRHRRPCSGTT